MPTFAGVTPNTAGRVGEAQVAAGGDLDAAADAVAADHRDRRLREVPQGRLRGEVVAADDGHRVGRVGPAEQVGDVGARAEAGAGAGDHQHADGGVVGQLREDAGQPRPHRRRHRVALLGTVDGQHGDVPLAGHAEFGPRAGTRRELASGGGHGGPFQPRSSVPNVSHWLRVAGLVAGGEPLLPLLGRPVRERVLVDPAAAEVPLDEVVADPRRGVQCPGDVVGVDLGDQRQRRSRRARSSAWLAQVPA